MRNAVIVSGLVLALAGGVSAQTKPRAQAQSNQQLATVPFINAANRAGQMEIALAQMAESQASSSRVKAFARMIASDHRQAAQELGVMAAMKGVTLPADQAMTGVDAVTQLQNLKGKAFDVAFVDQMIANHLQAIRDFQQAAAGPDGDVKAFAAKTLPTLQKHLQEAQNLKKSF